VDFQVPPALELAPPFSWTDAPGGPANLESEMAAGPLVDSAALDAYFAILGTEEDPSQLGSKKK
jgi:hypothetical protein